MVECDWSDKILPQGTRKRNNNPELNYPESQWRLPVGEAGFRQGYRKLGSSEYSDSRGFITDHPAIALRARQLLHLYHRTYSTGFPLECVPHIGHSPAIH